MHGPRQERQVATPPLIGDVERRSLGGKAPHEILGLHSPQARDSDVRAAFRKHSKTWHPDRHGNQRLPQWDALNTAQQIMLDPNMRAEFYNSGAGQNGPGRVRGFERSISRFQGALIFAAGQDIKTYRDVLRSLYTEINYRGLKRESLSPVTERAIAQGALRIARTESLFDYGMFTSRFKDFGFDSDEFGANNDLRDVVQRVIVGLARDARWNQFDSYINAAVGNTDLPPNLQRFVSALLNTDEMHRLVENRLRIMLEKERQSKSYCRFVLGKLQKSGIDTFPIMVRLGINRMPTHLHRALQAVKSVRKRK